MKPTIFKEVDFEDIEINGTQVLFTENGIDQQSVPSELFVYDIRYDDDGCEFATIEPYVSVNHAGTISSRAEIPMTEGGYAPIKTYSFT